LVHFRILTLAALIFLTASSADAAGLFYQDDHIGDRNLSAEDVMSAVSAGESLDFDNKIIVGHLNLSSLEIDGPVHFIIPFSKMELASIMQHLKALLTSDTLISAIMPNLKALILAVILSLRDLRLMDVPGSCMQYSTAM